MTELNNIYPIQTGRDAQGGLSLAGHSLVELAERFGTPLYVFDAFTVRRQVEVLRTVFSRAYPGAVEIAYAAKAYFSLGMARRLAGLKLGVDVVSLGEFKLARLAGFPAERIHLHGNNKGPQELDAAIANGVQAIVIDSLEELDYVESRAAALQKSARVWLRVTPGVAVDTHPYRQTAHAASKFGLLLEDGSAREGIRRALASRHVRLTGLHMHLGSQLFETEPYARAVGMLLALAADCGFAPEELSPGGGWGVPYTPEDEECDPRDWAAAVGAAVQEACVQHGFKLPRLVIEPGRWIVARAGLAIYTVGTQKRSGNGGKIVAVDGGMADNPRPALYHARYTACVAERPDAAGVEDVRVVGKFCESGDELISQVRLPEMRRGEHLVIPAAGAYQLSMASNYNLAPRPAVLWLEEGRVEVLQRREEAHEASWWISEDGR